MVKKRCATAIGAVILLALAGCSASQGGGGETTELTVWTQTEEGPELEYTERVIAAFEDENPGVTVNLEQRSTDGHKDAIRRVAGTSAGPDVFFYWTGPGLGKSLVDVGLSQDLTQYYEEYDWDERFTSAALAGVTQYGGYHGVPNDQQAMALYYNKDLFEQAGIDSTPTSYNELIQAADALVEADITPIAVGGTVNWHAMRILDSLVETQCGAETHMQLAALEASWAEEDCVGDAYSEFKAWGDDYFNDGYLGIDNTGASQLFFSGQAAMILEGPWLVEQAETGGMDLDDIGIFPFPTETGRLSAFGDALYISSESENKDLAAKYIDFVTSEEVQEEMGATPDVIPVNKNVDPETDNPLNAEWVQIADEAEGVFSPADSNLPLAITTEYWRVQNSVLTGDIAPEDAGDALQSFIDNQ